MQESYAGEHGTRGRQGLQARLRKGCREAADPANSVAVRRTKEATASAPADSEDDAEATRGRR